MSESRVAIGIVGVGVKGTYAFHRLAVNSVRAEFTNKKIEVFLIDSNDLGAGETYPIGSEDYLMMNTVASQITAYSDSSNKIEGDLHDGPNLSQWLNMNNRQISPNEYPKRREHGAYLNSVVRDSLKLIREDIPVTFIRSKAKDLIYGRNGYVLSCEDETEIELDVVLLSFGGQGFSEPRISVNKMSLSVEEARSKGMRFSHCYPLERWKNSILPSESVGVIGMGLGMIDAVMSLTVDRGGKFERDREGKMMYRPSGQEPKILCWCRSGLPALARAKNQKNDDQIFRAKHTTLSAIDDLRKKNPTALLDFKQELFPLLLKDMEAAYSAAGYPSNGKYFGSFDWDAWENPEFTKGNGSRTKEQFTMDLIDYLSEDIDEARMGNMDSAFKAACDVLRDIRDNIRYAVEYGGLSPDSHEYFLRDFSSTHNRLAVGPPLFRSEEMLALQRCGVVDMALGPQPMLGRDDDQWKISTTHFKDNLSIPFDFLVDGRVIRKKSEFLEKILMRGMVSLAKIGTEQDSIQTSAIRCDSQGRVVNSRGEVEQGIFVVGQPVEGYHWYTFVAARPGVNSRAISDADFWSLKALRYNHEN